MKKLLNTLMLALLVGSAFMVQARQKKEGNVSYKNELKGIKKVLFGFSNSTVMVEAHSGSGLIVEVKGFEPLPDRAKGLKPVYNSATDNTGVGLEANQEGDLLTLQRASSKGKVDYIIKLPASMGIMIEELNWSGGDIQITGMEGEIEIKSKNSNIKLIDIAGPLVAHTVSGNMDIVYKKLNPNQPNSIVATSGYIDISMPSNMKADITLSAVSGEIYTDFDIEFEKKKKGDILEKDSHKKELLGHQWKNDCNCSGWGNKMKGKVNGGGTEVSIKAISGNVYLRKK